MMSYVVQNITMAAMAGSMIYLHLELYIWNQKKYHIVMNMLISVCTRDDQPNDEAVAIQKYVSSH